MNAGWLQVAQETLKIPGLLVEIYSDLARPGVRQVGKALETIVGLGNTVLWPIALANERSRIALEKNLERYRRKMESLSEDKVCGVAPELGVPIAEKLSYVTDERLSDLYTTLLATASNQDTITNAHPSFVNVINNLSPDEAHLLEYFVNNSDLPFLRPRAIIPAGGRHSVLAEFILFEEVAAKLTFPKNVAAYLSNLTGLGLLIIKDNEWLSESDIYESIENQSRAQFEKLVSEHAQLKGRTLEFEKGVIQRTSFGWNFIQACHGA